jgi:N-hydroxyarylamine O-acetyltransferase
MNGLLGWALSEIGFPVVRLASGVMRSAMGKDALGNHLVLLVQGESGPVLADVGLGNGPIEPYDITPGPFTQAGHEFGLDQIGDGWWRLRNREGAMPPDFDFHLDLADEALLSGMCHSLQTDPQSIFVQNLICQRFVDGGGHLQLLGRTLRRTTDGPPEERLIESEDDLLEVLALEFGIDEPAARDVWPRVCARHQELFG